MGTLLTLGAMAKLDHVDSTERDELPAFPERIGPYVVQDRIGSGGMGEVYRAYDRRLDRHVAVKHIHPDSAEDPKVRRRLRREAHAVAKLNHPAIVQIFDILETDRGDMIVMELVEGRSLHELVKARQLTISQALFLVSEVANGLAEAHSKGVVHRDLKTENVMVTPAGHAKILDFGLAKLLLEGAGETILSIHGTIVGTGRAMSPEQAKGEPIDHRSDLFSLGSLLYEVVTGRPPFQGTSIISTLTRICGEKQPPAHELNPEVSEELSDLIDRLLSKNPDGRPDSTAVVTATLMDIAARLASADGTSPALVPGRGQIGRTDTVPIPTPISKVIHPESSSSVYIKTVVSVSLTVTPERRAGLGDARAAEVFLRHDRLVRDLLARWAGTEVSKGGSFLLVLERPVDAVELALAYHRQLSFLADELGLEADGLRGRVGIHLGEIFWREDDPSWGGTPFEVDAEARRIVLETEALAHPGQSLMTQGAYGIARRAFAGGSKPGADDGDELVWVPHGKYRFTQTGGTVKLFEVRAGSTPVLPPPVESDDVRRIGDPSESLPAPDFSLRRKPRRVSRTAAAALAFAALVAVGAAVVLLNGRMTGASPGEPRTIALEGFDDLAGHKQSAWFGAALSEVLTAHLEAGGALRSENAESTDPDFRMSGSYLSVHDRDPEVSVRLEVRDGAGNVVLGFEEVAAERELFELGARAGRRIRKELRLAALSAADRELVRALWPANPTALRLYAEGLAKARRAEPARARDLFRRALAHEPDHAPAHAALSESLLKLGDISLAAESARRAFERRAELPEPLALRIEGTFHQVSGHVLLSQSRSDEARQSFETARHRFEAAGDRVRVERVATVLASLSKP